MNWYRKFVIVYYLDRMCFTTYPRCNHPTEYYDLFCTHYLYKYILSFWLIQYSFKCPSHHEDIMVMKQSIVGSVLLDQFFFLQSSHIRVDLPSYESKATDKRGQNDWRAGKNLDGCKGTVHKKGHNILPVGSNLKAEDVGLE